MYCRISLAQDGDSAKVERQEADCRALCERVGWTVEYVFVDNNRSAWQRNRHRPGWDTLLEAVQAGLVDAIVVYHGDRLIRQPWDLELLLSLVQEKRLQLASPTGSRNLNSPDDRFILRIEAAQACRESDNISRRSRRGREAKRAAGIAAPGRTRAFGRNTDGSIREEEAAVIRDLAARLLAGESLRSLWRELVAKNVPTVSGKPWRYTSLHQVLLRPDLAGLVGYQGKVVGPDTVRPAILDREVWEALQLALGAVRSQHPTGPRPRKHLLTNIACCGSCKSPLVVAPNRDPALSRYRCVNDGCAARCARSLQHLDEYVIGHVLRRLSDPELWERVARQEEQLLAGDESAGAELAALEARRKMVLSQLAEDDAVSPDELARVLRRLDERIAAARGRIGSHRQVSVLDGLRGLDRRAWDALPLDRRRAIVRHLVTVEVYPSRRGPGFDKTSAVVEPVKV